MNYIEFYLQIIDIDTLNIIFFYYKLVILL